MRETNTNLVELLKPQAHRRARMGLHLHGRMPTTRELQDEFGMSHTAAQNWHAELARARRQFAE